MRIVIMNLRVDQVQSRFVHGHASIAGHSEVVAHTEIVHPIARLPRLEDTVPVADPPVSGVLIFHRESMLVPVVVNGEDLPRHAQMLSEFARKLPWSVRDALRVRFVFATRRAVYRRMGIVFLRRVPTRDYDGSEQDKSVEMLQSRLLLHRIKNI